MNRRGGSVHACLLSRAWEAKLIGWCRVGTAHRGKPFLEAEPLRRIRGQPCGDSRSSTAIGPWPSRLRPSAADKVAGTEMQQFRLIFIGTVPGTLSASLTADAEDLKSSGGNRVWVRFPPPAMICGDSRGFSYAQNS